MDRFRPTKTVGFKTGAQAFSADVVQADKNDKTKVIGIGQVYASTECTDVYAVYQMCHLDRAGGAAIGTDAATPVTQLEGIDVLTDGIQDRAAFS